MHGAGKAPRAVWLTGSTVAFTGKPFVIPLFIPHMGCPNRCVFCDQNTIVGGGQERLLPSEAAEEILRFLKFKKEDRSWSEIAFYGGNFLGLPIDYRNALLAVAQRFVDGGRIDGIRFSTRPDTISEASLQGLGPYRITTIELGVQSLDDHVLAASRRGHTAADSRRAVAVLKAWGGNIGLQIMPGLPGDTPGSIEKTGRGIVELTPRFVRIYPTVVVKGTTLAGWYRSGRFRPLSLDAAVTQVKALYNLFEGQGISVIRMGLQGSNDLVKPGSLVAGPYHPAFGHLVYSALFLDRMVDRFEAMGALPKRLNVRVNPRDVARAVGERRQNIRFLKDRFRLEDVTVISDPDTAIRGLDVAPGK